MRRPNRDASERGRLVRSRRASRSATKQRPGGTPARCGRDGRSPQRMILIGAHILDDNRCEFRVWAPFHESIALKLDDRLIPLTKRGEYHEALVAEVGEGARYFFVVDGRERPDPASRSQPDGVHAASEVIGADFEWHDDDWRGIPLEDHVIYELHVGTFTERGTFESAVDRLDE